MITAIKQHKTFTHRTNHLIQIARQEVLQHRHLYIGPEHLLLALLQERGGLTPLLFAQLDINTLQLRRSVEKAIADQDSLIGPVKRIRMHLPTPLKVARLLTFRYKRKGLNKRAQRVLIQASQEARHLQHPYIGPEHILLALLAPDAGLASHLLQSAGIRHQEIEDTILKIANKQKL